jgi:hypothetical protein
VNWVAPGILFPIISALSAFDVPKRGHWKLESPSLFKDAELIRRAVQEFRALEREVTVMGRSEAARSNGSSMALTVSA